MSTLEGILGREYGGGEVICKQGDKADCMYVLQRGQADVVQSEGGRDVLVGQLRAGDIFGEMAIFDRRPRSATVRARDNTRVLTLDKRAFLRRVHEDPSFAFHLLEKMSERIRQLDEQLSHIAGGKT